VLCNSQCSHSDATRHAEWWRSLLPSTANSFMYCHRLAVYRTSLETFWYTLVYTLTITHKFRLLCIPLTLISILEDRGPANNARYNHLPEEFGSHCIRLFPCNCHRDLYTYALDINLEYREIKAVTMGWLCRWKPWDVEMSSCFDNVCGRISDRVTDLSSRHSQTPTKRPLGVFIPGMAQQERKAFHVLYLVSRLRVRRAVPVPLILYKS
jgi:hypothetical protein